MDAGKPRESEGMSAVDKGAPQRPDRLPRLDFEEKLILCYSSIVTQALFLLFGIVGSIALAGMRTGDWTAAVLGGFWSGIDAAIHALPTKTTLVVAIAVALTLNALAWDSERRALSTEEGRAAVLRSRQSINGELPRLPLLALIALMSITGCVEELLFRYVLIGLALQLLTPVLPFFAAAAIGLLISSIVFWLAHTSYRSLATAQTFFLGVAFGVVFLATGSLAVVAIAHAVYNLSVLVIKRRQMRRDPDYFGGKTPDRLIMDEPDSPESTSKGKETNAKNPANCE